MLTADSIRSELTRAFAARHGIDCQCCEPFPDGRSPLELELLREARYAVARYERDAGVVNAVDERDPAELVELAELAACDALAAARDAITARVVSSLAGTTERPEPVLVPIDPTTYRVTCRAETFDGTYHRQCTRPASFTRDGLEVCRQHAKLPRIYAATV